MIEAESLYRQGTELLDTDPARSIELLTKSLEVNPDAPPALYNRALAYARVGRDAEAVTDISRLEQVQPELGKELHEKMKLSAAPYTDLAQEQFEKKNFAEAIKKCNSALAYDPDWSNAWVVKALSLEGLGQVEQALECYDKGAKAEPMNFFVFINRGRLHHQQKQFEKAIADYSKAIDLQPNDPDAYLGRAAVYSALHMQNQAAADDAKGNELKAKRKTENGE